MTRPDFSGGVIFSMKSKDTGKQASISTGALAGASQGVGIPKILGPEDRPVGGIYSDWSPCCRSRYSSVLLVHVLATEGLWPNARRPREGPGIRIDVHETAKERYEMSKMTHLTVQARDLTPAINPAMKHAALQPRVEIDGQEHVASWGGNEFPVPPGKHEIRIYCLHKLYGKRLTRTTNVDIEADKACDLEYTIQPSRSSRWEAVLSVNGEPDATGIDIRSESELRRSKLRYIFFVLVGAPLGWFAFGPSPSISTSIAIIAVGFILLVSYVLWQRSIKS